MLVHFCLLEKPFLNHFYDNFGHLSRKGREVNRPSRHVNDDVWFSQAIVNHCFYRGFKGKALEGLEDCFISNRSTSDCLDRRHYFVVRAQFRRLSFIIKESHNGVL